MLQRLDIALVARKLAPSRSQAESYIKLGDVKVDGRVMTKPGYLVDEQSRVQMSRKQQYVSRAGLKLASVSERFKLDFRDKIVLDVGSSTGGFTDYALKHGAKRVVAVDVGTNQLHPGLRGNERIELHEQTDIRSVHIKAPDLAKEPSKSQIIIAAPDIIVIDVSFISLRDVLPHIATLMKPATLIVAMAKPQFEAGNSDKHSGVIKNEKIRRNILQNLEDWIKNVFVLLDKADSQVPGEKGNLERFYLLKAKLK